MSYELITRVYPVFNGPTRKQVQTLLAPPLSALLGTLSTAIKNKSFQSFHHTASISQSMASKTTLSQSSVVFSTLKSHTPFSHNASLSLHHHCPLTSSSSSSMKKSYLLLKKAQHKTLITNCTAPVATDTAKAPTPIELNYPSFPTVMDINQIREILPHRFPFLLVDRVIEYNPGVSAVAIKNVTINDNFFPGHFPERPIMPGVLMVEAMAQVGGIVMLQPEVGGSRENFFFAGVDKVRFRKPVVAGDTLVMRMTLTKLQKRFGIAKMDGKAYVGGNLVCEGEFLMAMGSE